MEARPFVRDVAKYFVVAKNAKSKRRATDSIGRGGHFSRPSCFSAGWLESVD